MIISLYHYSSFIEVSKSRFHSKHSKHHMDVKKCGFEWMSKSDWKKHARNCISDYKQFNVQHTRTSSDSILAAMGSSILATFVVLLGPLQSQSLFIQEIRRSNSSSPTPSAAMWDTEVPTSSSCALIRLRSRQGGWLGRFLTSKSLKMEP